MEKKQYKKLEVTVVNLDTISPFCDFMPTGSDPSMPD